MAQLLAPVRSVLVLEFPKLSPCYGNRWPSVAVAVAVAENSTPGRRGRGSRKKKRDLRIAAATVGGFSWRDDVADDYYTVLGLVSPFLLLIILVHEPIHELWLVTMFNIAIGIY